MPSADDNETHAKQACAWFKDRGLFALVVYHDDTGWHLAAPQSDWGELAKGLRTLARECEAKGLPSTRTLQ